MPQSAKSIENTWFVYILECRDGSWYTGITNDLEKRIDAHTHGRGAKYTKGRGPFTLIYSSICKNREEASRQEHSIKQLSRAQKECFIKEPLSKTGR
jgi:putative endonuclease